MSKIVSDQKGLLNSICNLWIHNRSEDFACLFKGNSQKADKFWDKVSYLCLSTNDKSAAHIVSEQELKRSVVPVFVSPPYLERQLKCQLAREGAWKKPDAHSLVNLRISVTVLMQISISNLSCDVQFVFRESTEIFFWNGEFNKKPHVIFMKPFIDGNGNRKLFFIFTQFGLSADRRHLVGCW